LPEREFLYLDTEGVLAIHAEVLAAHGGSPGLRDQGLLESAVAAPQASFGGELLIKEPVEVAALICSPFAAIILSWMATSAPRLPPRWFS
jgi:prophage maintenance system killer protein